MRRITHVYGMSPLDSEEMVNVSSVLLIYICEQNFQLHYLLGLFFTSEQEQQQQTARLPILGRTLGKEEKTNAPMKDNLAGRIYWERRNYLLKENEQTDSKEVTIQFATIPQHYRSCFEGGQCRFCYRGS